MNREVTTSYPELGQPDYWLG